MNISIFCTALLIVSETLHTRSIKNLISIHFYIKLNTGAVRKPEVCEQLYFYIKPVSEAVRNRKVTNSFIIYRPASFTSVYGVPVSGNRVL
jgi:hypothetical protein